MDDNIKAKMNKVLKSTFKLVMPIILIIIIILVFLAGITYWITVDDGTYKEDDWGSVPYAASTYASTVKVTKDKTTKENTIKNKTTVNELWEKMKENDSRVEQYLNSPEELARLMKAEIVTQYPDVRENPDDPIEWDKIVSDADGLQGIVKFKRANENNKTETMKYADPATFQSWIDAYNNNGDNSAKKDALSHFTLRKSSSSKTRKTNSNNTTKGYSGNAVDESKMYFIGDSWIAGLQNSGVAKTSYFYGQVGKHAGSPEMAISNIPEKNDISAIVLYLGVNDPSSYSKMNSLIDELVTLYSGKPIYVVEVSPVNPDKYSGAVTNEQIEKYNEIVKQHCDKTENVTFLSIASNVTDSDGKLMNTSDGLHLNSYQDWYDGIISAITKGTTGQTQSNDNTQKSTLTKVDGDGYNNEYTSSAGITYKCYKQYEGSYSSNRYWKSNPNGTIRSSGCGPTSVAILTSGLRDANITPAETAKSMYDRHRIYWRRIFKRGNGITWYDF